MELATYHSPRPRPDMALVHAPFVHQESTILSMQHCYVSRATTTTMVTPTTLSDGEHVKHLWWTSIGSFPTLSVWYYLQTTVEMPLLHHGGTAGLGIGMKRKIMEDYFKTIVAQKKKQ